MIEAILYFIAFAALQILPSSLLLWVWPHTGITALDSTELLMAATALSSVLTLVLFTALKWARPARHYLLSRPYAVVLWAIIAACGTAIPSTWLQELMPELPDLVEQQMSDILMHRGGYFIICILAPLTEELAFRGAILRSLLAWRPQHQWGMIALSALMFALMHANPAQMPHAMLMGLLMGWMYARTQSIVPSLAFHWANNTIAYLLFRAYPDPSLRLADYFGGDTRAVGAALIFSLFIMLPSIFQLHQRMRKA